MSAAVALPLALQGASAIGGAISSYRTGQMQGQALDQQAYSAFYEAGVTEQAGTEAVRQVTKQAAFLRGSQEEAAAGGGVASNTGSPLSVQQEDAREMKYNELKTQFNYNSKVYALQRQGQLDNFYAQKARQAGIWNMATGVLTSGAQAFYQAKGGGFGTSDPGTQTKTSALGGYPTNTLDG